ncbi:MAG: ribose-phosphate pyrophosphokinase-like domain-containing protein, partial [Ignavibacteria bacterium]|nr:ribose-phosphate pyrophosphokinase-like domain-containing protein [Ignavibacteria bacterium]
MSKGFKIFAGSSNKPLAEKICKYLGIRLGKCEIKRFSDGEIWVKYSENIRGKDIFIVQSTNTPADNMI